MKRHKSHFPLAVYEATFGDGSKARLSFGRRRKDGSPDADFGRSMVELLWCRESIGPAPAPFKVLVDKDGKRAHWSGTKDKDAYAFTIVPALTYINRKPAIVDGVIEFRGERSRDPHFEPVSDKPTQIRTRVTAKQALRELLRALEEPEADISAALEEARRIAA
jgi:hypothetical protein